MKEYLDRDGLEYYHSKLKDKFAEKKPYETDGGVDTLFDTEYDATNQRINFGSGTAQYVSETQTLVIEGAVVGDLLVVS